MKTFKKLKKGFTLVELVVVIAVIAILAAVSVGAYFGVTESANKSRLEQESKQVYTAIQTVALAPNEHSSLTASGLVVSDAYEFEQALETNLGKTVVLTSDADKKDSSEPTIYFSSAEYSASFTGGSTVYKSFEYHIPDVNGKKAVLDVVNGDSKVMHSEVESEELPETLKTVTTIEEALTAPVDSPVEISGTVSSAESWNSTYNNITFILSDDSGNEIKVYRCNTKVTVGDIVIVKGTIGVYNNINQVAAGSTATITDHDTSYDEIEYITTIPEALAAPEYSYVKVIGAVVKINTEYNEEYDNISVTISDEEGNKIYVYRMKGNVNINDIIEVTGQTKTFEGQIQIVESEFVLQDEKHVCSTWTEATCTSLEKCIVCNSVKDGSELAEHVDANTDGVCDVCNNNVDAKIIEATITFDDITKRTEYTTSKQVWVENGITVTNNKSSSSSNVGDFANPARFYKSSNVKIEVNGKINRISIDAPSDENGKYATPWEATLEEKNIGTVTVSNNVYTLELNNPSNAVEFTASAQVRANSITVTYSSETSDSTEGNEHVDHEFDTNGNCTYEGCEAQCSHETWRDQNSTSSTCNVCGFTCNHSVEPGNTCYYCGYQEPMDTEEEDTWTLVKDASVLAVGDQIIIAAKDSNFALSTTQNNNNRGQADITKNGDTLSSSITNVQILTLEAGKISNTFAFNTGSSGYLYAASTSYNYLRTRTTLDDNASWTIAVTSAGVATIKAQGTNTKNWLRHNSSSSLFSCYSSGQADIVIYKLS